MSCGHHQRDLANEPWFKLSHHLLLFEDYLKLVFASLRKNKPSILQNELFGY
jgi:hypothetical protein